MTLIKSKRYFKNEATMNTGEPPLVRTPVRGKHMRKNTFTMGNFSEDNLYKQVVSF